MKKNFLGQHLFCDVGHVISKLCFNIGICYEIFFLKRKMINSNSRYLKHTCSEKKLTILFAISSVLLIISALRFSKFSFACNRNLKCW